MGTGVKLRTRTRHHPGQRHANQAANPGQHRGFHQELIEDILAARAHRFADADFVRALRHHRQHDVHNHHAAHHHEDAHHAHRRRGDRAGQIVPRGNQSVGGDESKCRPS